ncbi:Dam family site-specific DNA-(adenine-N6)-methyltransferase [candidate division KSB1 bacterium]|nr:Dam family site-specific DNA-(adenine-N6)-methyltransferase [candidate division KSB1 bacterium]
MTNCTDQRPRVQPFIKWPGGKRWIVPTIRGLVDGRNFANYIEPFLGGGAVYFGLLPTFAHLSDINKDLINTYLQVRDHPRAIMNRIQMLRVTKPTYNRLRASEPSDPIDRAVRFLYLNRTCFGGVYRLNANGEFNVPFGGGERGLSPFWKDNLLINASRALSNCHIEQSDFEPIIGRAKHGDLVYCDPTYTVTHNNNGFIRYNEKNWTAPIGLDSQGLIS